MMVSNVSNKVVFTNGCFFLLHPGHIQLFKEIHDRYPHHKIVVGLNSQKSIQLNKAGREVQLFADTDRKAMIEALRYVDEVILFDEKTPYELIKKIRPDVLVKGGDYHDQIVVGSDIVEEVLLIEITKDYSTSRIIETLKKL